jgi:putative thioredoxin
MMSEANFIFEATAENFSQVVLQESLTRPVLVDFWADWCAPCKSLMPLLAKLVDEYQGKFVLAKVNTEEQRELAAQFGIRSLPTVQLFHQGQAVDEFMGALPEAEVRAFLERHMPRESDHWLDQADQLLSQGSLEQAADLIERARQLDPQYPRTHLSAARYQAATGEFAAAEQLLMQLPLGEQQKPAVTSMLARIHFARIAQEAPPVEELQQSLAKDANNPEALYQLASHRILEHDYAGALELLLSLMQKDRKYADDAGRKGILQVFEMLGDNSELVKRYRNLMFNALH